jgi:hypothetical protein
MAVTITQQPAYATPSDNPIIFAFKQTLSGKFNMSFVIDVFVGGSIGTYEVFPEFEDATYVYAKIDVSNIVAPYIPTQNIKPINSATIFDPDGYRFISIDVYEKYSTTINGPISVNPTPVSSNQIGVFKGKLSRTEFLNWDYTDYQKGLLKELMTNRSYRNYLSFVNLYEQTVKKEDSLTYTWIDNTDIDTPANYKVRYTYYNGTTIIKQTDESFTTSNQGLLGSIYFNLDNHVSLGYLTSGEAASCTSVLIGLLNASDINLSCVSWIYFDNTCFFNGATLRFMNKFGAYDNYLFTYNKRYSASVKAFEFERSQGSWNSGVYSLSKTNTGRLNYLKQTTKKLELSSDWLDETTQNWLTQLYDSPAVYINDGEENESVIVANSSYQIKQDKHDELFNEIVEIEFTPENSIRI